MKCLNHPWVKVGLGLVAMIILGFILKPQFSNQLAALGDLDPIWTTTTLATGQSYSHFLSTVVAQDGYARIVYTDTSTLELKFIRCTNSDCSTKNVTILDSIASYFDDTYPSLALDANGNARISYFGNLVGNSGHLKFIQCTDADCSTKVTTVVDPANRVGLYTSLALGADGNARISYYDEGGYNLKFVHCTSADCLSKNIRALDTTGEVGQNTSLALDANGNAQIVYDDNTNQRLKFIRCTNADCSVNSTSTLAQNASFPSLIVGSDGNALISYYDNTDNSLKFSQCTSANCSTKNTTTIDSTENLGSESSLALAPDGFARIVYLDQTNSQLKFVQCTNLDCSTKRVSVAEQGYDDGVFSLALGAGGLGRIVYIDIADQKLKFANEQPAPPPDTAPPLRSGGLPSGVQSEGTTQVTLALGTDETATCKYGTTPNIAYADIPNTFTVTNGITHSQTITGLSEGSYTYYVRCTDGTNANLDDYGISFSIPASSSLPPDSDSTSTPETCTSFTYSDWTPEVCPSSGQQTRTATGTPDGCIDGNPVLTRTCTVIVAETVLPATTTPPAPPPAVETPAVATRRSSGSRVTVDRAVLIQQLQTQLLALLQQLLQMMLAQKR